MSRTEALTQSAYLYVYTVSARPRLRTGNLNFYCLYHRNMKMVPAPLYPPHMLLLTLFRILSFQKIHSAPCSKCSALIAGHVFFRRKGVNFLDLFRLRLSRCTMLTHKKRGPAKQQPYTAHECHLNVHISFQYTNYVFFCYRFVLLVCCNGNDIDSRCTEHSCGIFGV